MRTLTVCICLVLSNIAAATPAGFVKRIIPLDAPPVGLAFDADGVLYALEGASFGSNVATMRSILPDNSFGASFNVVGDDSSNFFVGAMAYDPLGDRLLVTDNTADGRLYAISKSGVKQILSTGLAGAAGVAARHTGEVFVTTAPFGSAGAVFEVDRTSGAATSVLSNLGYGAGLVFDLADDLIVQDADTNTFQGRLQRLPINDTPIGIEIGTAVPLLSGMQSSAGVTVNSESDIFTTGSGGLFQVTGSPLAETPFDSNGNQFQFSTAIAFAAGSHPFERFAGPNGGRLAYMADFGFAAQDSFVTILTPADPGDYNSDGQVDNGDYLVWRSHFGSTTDLSADGNGDGVVDAADYVIWRRSLPNGGGASSAASQVNVPESGVLAGLVIAIFLAILFCRIHPCKRKNSADANPC